MLKIMYDQYKTITLSGLAEQLHYTVPYCSKYLKNVFGCTFSAMIQKIRFQNAECLLRNSDMTVSEVGKEIGYEHTENFFRVFKKHYLPLSIGLQYRKRPICKLYVEIEM